MTGAPEGSVIGKAIIAAEEAIKRQRTVISERTARGMPVDTLGPMLREIEGNLRMLTKVQTFVDARTRQAPRGRR